MRESAQPVRNMPYPRVYCDFNGALADGMYSLGSTGTREDLARLGVRLAVGLKLELYDFDGFDDGRPAWIVADAVVVAHSRWGLVARLDLAGFRWELRDE